MTPLDAWLQAALADADRRGLPDLKPMIEALARATMALRAADFNQSPVLSPQSPVGGPQSPVGGPQSSVSVDSRQS